MALVQMDFFSKTLAGTVGFNMVLPNDMYPEMLVGNENYKRKMKTLYLLHGYSGTNKDWLLGSCAQEMALKYNLAIVMPSGGNSFYLDAKGVGSAYSQYVGKELVEYTKKVFGLSDKKEDTAIGGYSMGGFGAIHTALAFPETFSKVIALSSALIVHNIEHKKEDFKDLLADYDYYASVFGDLDKLDTSLNNPEYQIRTMKEQGKAIPPIFLACGTEDFLLNENCAFHKFLQDEKVDVTYIEAPGVHNWSFWNAYLESGIQWMLA